MTTKEILNALKDLSDKDLEKIKDKSEEIVNKREQKSRKEKLIGTYHSVSDFPEEVKTELYEYFRSYLEKEPVEDLIDLISDYTSDEIDLEQTGSDSSYIYYEGSFQTESFKIIRSGSEYLKDHSICDMEYDDFEIYKI